MDSSTAKYYFKNLEIGGKIVKFKMEMPVNRIEATQKMMDTYDNIRMSPEYDAVLHNTDLVYNFLLENNIPMMDTTKQITPAYSKSADISADALKECECALQELYKLDYLDGESVTEIWKKISKQWYSSLEYTSGIRCSDVMQISLDGIQYVAPGVLDIRRNLESALEQPFPLPVIMGVLSMYLMEYIYPYPVMTGVIARMILQYHLRMPGVQIWKEMYMNSHEYRKVFIECTKPDIEGVIDLSKYFDYVFKLIEKAYERYCAKMVPLTEEERDAYNTLLKKGLSVMPVHIAITPLRLGYSNGVAMLNELNKRGRIEFTDSHNIVIYRRED